VLFDQTYRDKERGEQSSLRIRLARDAWDQRVTGDSVTDTGADCTAGNDLSTADERALHVLVADEAVCIGPSPAVESYLNFEAVIEAARQTGADAVHPGYGFLSENPSFADACARAGLVFVGPPAEATRAVGPQASA